MKDQPLKASISASASYQLGEPILITFEIENTGSETYQLLGWDTPLEPETIGDFLILQRDGEKIPYDGVFVKHGDPSPESYVLIGPGEKLKRTVDISTAYPIHEPGDYTATLNASLSDVFPITGATKMAPRSRSYFEPQSLSPSTVKFKVVVGREVNFTPRLTSGELVREVEMRVKAIREEKKEPSFNGGTDTQQADTLIAHKNAQSFAAKCESKLGDRSVNELYNTWFGALDQSRYDNVTKHFTDIANALQSKQVTYDFTGRSPAGHSCRPAVFAFTYKGAHTVWLCSAYLSAPQIGIDSKFGTLCHEWSHAICNTNDYVYGESDCKTIATDDPEKATNNADSHEYFAEHLAQD